jgi:hypothetical protein
MTQSVEVPAVAYLTNASKAYYERREDVEAIGFTLQLSWDEEQLSFPDSGNKPVQYERIPEAQTDPNFLNGRLWFYKLETRTGPVGRPVRRVAALGLTNRGEFGFFKTVDYLDYSSNGSSGAARIDFQTFASNGGDYRHEGVIEAGSLTRLA